MKLRRFFGELKRRNVYRIAVGYPVIGWLLIQVATQVFPFFEVPNWVIRYVILALVVGYPIALVLAWAFDLTPRGIRRAKPAEPDRDLSAPTTRRARPTSPAPHKSIAVLPFKNLSDEQQNSYFTDGVQDEILTALARVAELKVISRSSVMHYGTGAARDALEIGEQLGVAHLLEGSVQRAGGKVRVNVQLTDARTEAQLWAEHYDRDLADVFAIQSEIAQAIAAQLQAKLSPLERLAIATPATTDLPAYDLYTRARALMTSTTFSGRAKGKFLEAAALLERALARDPSFLLAQCELASVHSNLYFQGYDRTPERLALAESAVQTALRLRPDAGEAHLALARYLYRGFLDYDHARAELEIARRTLPNSATVYELTGYIDRRQGRHEDGIRNLERALELDPRSGHILQQVSVSYRLLRRYSEAAATLDRALAINPANADTRIARAVVDVDWKAETQPLHTTIYAILADDPSAAESIADSWLLLALCERDADAAARALVAMGGNSSFIDAVPLSRAFNEGLVARMVNNHTAAERAFSTARAQQAGAAERQDDAPSLCALGMIEAGLNNKAVALQYGRRAMELLPVAKDSLNGAHMIEFFAVIAAWTGEKELALEHLATAARLPGAISYGMLKLHPFWDPLRGEPRFDDIVASLAPGRA